MEIKPVRNEADYEAALRRIEALWRAARELPKVMNWMCLQPSSKLTSAITTQLTRQTRLRRSSFAWNRPAKTTAL